MKKIVKIDFKTVDVDVDVVALERNDGWIFTVRSQMSLLRSYKLTTRYKVAAIDLGSRSHFVYSQQSDASTLGLGRIAETYVQ